MQDRIIEWCPDIQGPCIKDRCAAYINKITYKMDDISSFLNKFAPGLAVEKMPLLFGLDVFFCKKYELFLDQESEDIFKMFISDINEVIVEMEK